MKFVLWFLWQPLTRADIRNPHSDHLKYYHSLLRSVPSVFLLSNSMRKEASVEIVFLRENTNEDPFLLRFDGKHLRYLSPDLLSTGAILVKAFKRLSMLYDHTDVFVNPGVSLENLPPERSNDLFQTEYVLRQVKKEQKFSDFELFLNMLPLNDDSIRIDLVFENSPMKPRGIVAECGIDSVDQAITIINFRKDEVSNAG